MMPEKHCKTRRKYSPTGILSIKRRTECRSSKRIWKAVSFSVSQQCCCWNTLQIFEHGRTAAVLNSRYTRRIHSHSCSLGSLSSLTQHTCLQQFLTAKDNTFLSFRKVKNSYRRIWFLILKLFLNRR